MAVFALRAYTAGGESAETIRSVALACGESVQSNAPARVTGTP